MSDVRLVPRGFDTLAPMLLDGAARWLELLADHPGMRLRSTHAVPVTGGDGRQSVALRVGPGRGAARLPVLVSLGVPRVRLGRVVLPIRWDPVVFDRFLPTLDGDIELSPSGEGSSVLGLAARYRVPLGEAGKALDRLALHRVAEGSVRDFLDAVEGVLVPSGPVTDECHGPTRSADDR